MIKVFKDSEVSLVFYCCKYYVRDSQIKFLNRYYCGNYYLLGLEASKVDTSSAFGWAIKYGFDVTTVNLNCVLCKNPILSKEIVSNMVVIDNLSGIDSVITYLQSLGMELL